MFLVTYLTIIKIKDLSEKTVIINKIVLFYIQFLNFDIYVFDITHRQNSSLSLNKFSEQNVLNLKYIPDPNPIIEVYHIQLWILYLNDKAYKNLKPFL